MVKRTNKTVKIATYGALLAVMSGAIATPVSAATSNNTGNVKVENIKENAAKLAASTKTGASAVKPTAGVNGVVSGQMSYGGSAVGGLKVNNGITSGNITFDLNVTELAGINVAQETYFRVKLPEEFRALAATTAFRNAISGSFHQSNFGGVLNTDYNYSQSDIHVDTTNNEIVFKNRPMTNLEFFSSTKMSVSINLGDAITKSGVHIADSYDGYYHAESVMAQNDSWLDWTIFGNTRSSVNIPLRQMDPGAGSDTGDNTRPEIHLPNEAQQVSANSVYDRAKAMEGVTATDKEDGDITSKVVASYSSVDTSKPGMYIVSYSVKDSKGLEAQTSRMIQVLDDAKDYTLTANSYQMGSKEITGTYGKDVKAVDISVNGEVKAHAILSNGKFTVADADKVVTDKNQFVEAIALDKDGKEQARKTVTITGEVQKDYSLTPDAYLLGTKTITGIYGKDVERVQLYVDGTFIETATLNNGRFSLDNVDYFVKSKTQKVNVIAVGGGYQQTVKPVTILGEDADYSLTANTYQIGSSALTGTFGKDITQVDVSVNGQIKASASLNNGNFTLYNADKFITDKNQFVEVIGRDKDGKEQARRTVVLKGEVQKDYSLSANSYKIGTSTLTGTLGKDIRYVRVSVDGKIVKQADVTRNSDGTGTFTAKGLAGIIKNKSQKVEVIGVDKQYSEHARKLVTVTGDDIKDYSLSANSYEIGSASLTGSLGADIAKVRLFVNGEVKTQATVTVGKDGKKTFAFNDAKKYVTKKSQKVEVVGVDSAYKERARKQVTVTGDDVKDYSITPNEYKIGSDTLTGKIGADVEQVRLFVNGESKRAAIVTGKDGNKTFTFDKLAGKGIITSKNQKVEVVAKDGNYVEHTRKQVTVTGDDVTNDYSLTANTYNLGSSTLTGTYGTNVNRVRLVVNGQTVAKATLNSSNHTYQFAGVDRFVTENEDQIVVKADDSNYHEVNSVNVNKNGSIVHDYALTSKDYILGESTLSGTSGADIKYVRIRVNGKVVKQADIENGNWNAKGLTGLINKGDKVEAVGVDKQYKEKATVNVNVLAENPNLDYSLTAPNTFTIGTTETLQGTWGRDLKAVRLLVNGEVKKNADLNTNDHTYTLKGLLYVDIKPGDTVEVIGYGEGYKQVVSKQLNVIG